MKLIRIGFVCFAAQIAFANPYPDPNAVPVDPEFHPSERVYPRLNSLELRRRALGSLRVLIEWESDSDKFTFKEAVVEKSGTESLVRRSSHRDQYGSYVGELVHKDSGEVLFSSSVGTGQEFRKLTRGISFRFPEVFEPVLFRFHGENPKSGKSELLLSQMIYPNRFERPLVAIAQTLPEPEVRLLKKSVEADVLILNIYSEGYQAARREQFFKDAERVVNSLEKNAFPGFASFTFQAVFSPSETKIGAAKDLGLPVKERDSYLGLYFPYWNPFGRWYHVVYPTSEQKYRRSIAQVPYDYPIVLVDDSAYWGVGNFNELTAIPAGNSSFTYLLLHEFGHFFGLNEEYEGGGPTELAFAPEIEEPWSQNITFLSGKSLKWSQLIEGSTPIPTPSSYWKGNGPFGAYRGGYADTEPQGKSHKPAYNCIMTSGKKFCPICHHAIEEKVKFDISKNLK